MEMIYITTLNENVYSSSTIYAVLFVICFINISISSAYFYCHWYLKKVIRVNTSANTEKVIS